MGMPSRPRSSIAGTSLFAVTFLGLSTGYAYLDPEGLDRFLGGGAGQPLCSASGSLPCSDTMPAAPCPLLLVDEEADACVMPGGETTPDHATVPATDAPLLDCCKGSVSRGALLRASTSVATPDTPKGPESPSLEDEATPSAPNEAPAPHSDTQE
ncbi:hypothetical protein [Tautonia marina]|uniref:hypothetical protein n=1 Tax=Tautonia marina TaxID=2653855 RepID=UPI001260FAF9|nr:hypothetical protein [Tautonia marina]